LTIDALQPLLVPWISSITTNPQKFAIPACSYASIEATAFPALTDGIYPLTIIDHRGFPLLLMDMRYGLAWQLHCNRVPTITMSPGLQFADILAAGRSWYFYRHLPQRRHTRPSLSEF
jgi:hypothetical protein